jgi:hypothetical protein
MIAFATTVIELIDDPQFPRMMARDLRLPFDIRAGDGFVDATWIPGMFGQRFTAFINSSLCRSMMLAILSSSGIPADQQLLFEPCGECSHKTLWCHPWIVLAFLVAVDKTVAVWWSGVVNGWLIGIGHSRERLESQLAEHIGLDAAMLLAGTD